MTAETQYHPQAVALIAPLYSLAASANARLYDEKSYYSWIFGVLRSYDVTDILAAVLALDFCPSILVYSPVDELMRALDVAAAEKAYKFPKSVAGGPNLTVDAGGDGSEEAVADAVANWFGKLQR